MFKPVRVLSIGIVVSLSAAFAGCGGDGTSSSGKGGTSGIAGASGRGGGAGGRGGGTAGATAGSAGGATAGRGGGAAGSGGGTAGTGGGVAGTGGAAAGTGGGTAGASGTGGTGGGTGGAGRGGTVGAAGVAGTGGAAGRGGTTGAAGTGGGSGGAAGRGGAGGTAGVAGSSGAGGGAAGRGGTTGTAGRGGIGGGGTGGGIAGRGGTIGAAGNGGGAGSIANANVTIDRNTQYQTIDGFGFFGAQDNWWGAPSDLWSDAWGTLVINDLGITIWRSEYYAEEANQDANWAKQMPVVQGFKRIADANRVPLKFILTVWTPPSSMKCTVASVQAGTSPCAAHPDKLKNGGTLDPSKYTAYGQWLAQGIKNYADAGVSLYAISPQNEPMFVEPYNSCVYDIDASKLNSYARMVAAVAPVVKAAYPNVKIFGTENMLELEGQQWFYSAMMSTAGWNALDLLAYHGYQDGVAPTSSSQLATYWNYVRTMWDAPHNKPAWMTETSGYTDNWTATDGARSLAFAIFSALSYGQASAWVWWQGSEVGGAPGQYTLMGGTQFLGKRYYVSKQFYRYIRPGARMLKVTSTDSSLFVVAFAHPTTGAFTVVAINTASTDKPLNLGGANVPSTFTAYRTSASENCVTVGSVTNGSITVKADSVTTLVNGNVVE
jgi:glucuronoarabinoxylan endo-1,4-beta-xylanase